MKFAIACLAVAGMTLVATPRAEAGGRVAISIGGPGFGFGYRSVGYRGFGYRSVGYRSVHYGPAIGVGRVVAPVVPVYPAPVAHWHDTSHWHYTPGTTVSYGNGYHYVAPTYRFHQSGFWHVPGY